jgi:hypothetical protein
MKRMARLSQGIIAGGDGRHRNLSANDIEIGFGVLGQIRWKVRRRAGRGQADQQRSTEKRTEPIRGENPQAS